MTQSKRIERRIEKSGEGWVFTPADFLDLGSPQSVGMTLLRLAKRGRIRRIDRGLYDFPRRHPTLGLLHARPEAVLAAISRRDGTEFHEHEAQAANKLRLTEQVPGKLVYLTPGRSRTIKAGPVTLELQHRAPRKLTAPAPMSATVFAALRNLGKTHVTPARLHHLRALLEPTDRRKLLSDLTKAPAWMHPHLRAIATEEGAP